MGLVYLTAMTLPYCSMRISSALVSHPSLYLCLKRILLNRRNSLKKRGSTRVLFDSGSLLPPLPLPMTALSATTVATTNGRHYLTVVGRVSISVNILARTRCSHFPHCICISNYALTRSWLTNSKALGTTPNLHRRTKAQSALSCCLRPHGSEFCDD